jgi:gliding motility-associated lipoprotein GldD
MIFKTIKILLISFLLFSCNSGAKKGYMPKPKGFPRIELPPLAYQILEGDYPFTFEYSKSAVIVPDNSKDAEPYWIIVKYPSLNAMIQFTYKPINGNTKKLESHIADAYKLASKHQKMATSQVEKVTQLKNGRKVVVIEIEGEVPSHFQFYTTDTTQHFLRGAVYLNNATFNDSLSPIVDFMKLETKYLIESLKFKK